MTTSQLGRFLRLFLVALVAGGALSTAVAGWNLAALVGAIVAAAEVAWRGLHPVVASTTTSSSTSSSSPPKVP